MMKARYWLLPVSMLISTWLHALICEQLPRNAELLPAAVTLLLFLLVGLLLRRTCTRKTVLLSSAGLLLFSLILTILHQLPSLGSQLGQFIMGLAFLWDALFFLFLRLPLPDIPVLFFLLPALIPFSWALFCRQTS